MYDSDISTHGSDFMNATCRCLLSLAACIFWPNTPNPSSPIPPGLCKSPHALRLIVETSCSTAEPKPYHAQVCACTHQAKHVSTIISRRLY